jgi:ankyrin repeat protein
MNRSQLTLISSVLALVVILALAAGLVFRLVFRERLTDELQSAVHERKIERIRALVWAGADPNVQLDADFQDGDTAATEAAYAGDVRLLDLLLARGLRIDGGTGGYNALMAASGMGNMECVRFLLKRGAHPSSVDDRGETPLMRAAADTEAGAAVIPLLVRAGAPLETRDHSGRTALMWAADRRHPAAVLALLHAGADADARDPHGKTIQDIARSEPEAIVSPDEPTFRRNERETIRILRSWKLSATGKRLEAFSGAP